MNDHWLNIGYCDCKDSCVRWGIYADGNGGYFCPYVPEEVESVTNRCKKLNQVLGKNIGPTTIENNQ